MNWRALCSPDVHLYVFIYFFFFKLTMLVNSWQSQLCKCWKSWPFFHPPFPFPFSPVRCCRCSAESGFFPAHAGFVVFMGVIFFFTIAGDSSHLVSFILLQRLNKVAVSKWHSSRQVCCGQFNFSHTVGCFGVRYIMQPEAA